MWQISHLEDLEEREKREPMSVLKLWKNQKQIKIKEKEEIERRKIFIDHWILQHPQQECNACESRETYDCRLVGQPHDLINQCDDSMQRLYVGPVLRGNILYKYYIQLIEKPRVGDKTGNESLTAGVIL